MIIENAYHGILGGSLCKPNGRVDQLEDRYLGMVEAPSSNLGTSTTLDDNRPIKRTVKVKLTPEIAAKIHANKGDFKVKDAIKLIVLDYLEYHFTEVHSQSK